MKWWLVLVAFVLGVLVTWLMTRRGDEEPLSTSERPVSASEPADAGERLDGASATAVPDESPGEVDDASAFAGSPSEFSSDPGAAESWHRDAQDEDALLSHESEPEATRAGVEASVPPVAEATPNGDVAGVGEPETVKAVDAVEVEPGSVGDDEPDDEPDGGPGQRV